MADSSVPDPVLVEKKEGYAVVTLNDPDRRNVSVSYTHLTLPTKA